MIVRVYSSALLGVDGIEVEVEVSAFNAEKPAINVVGLPDAAVRESCATCHVCAGDIGVELGGRGQDDQFSTCRFEKGGAAF